MAKTSKKANAKPVAKATAKKATATAKKATVAVEKTPRKTYFDDAKEPPKGKSVMDVCIDLMRRPGGAGIADFQTVKGFAVPSMSVVRAAEKRGYKATFSKVPGERTVYKATGKANA